MVNYFFAMHKKLLRGKALSFLMIAALADTTFFLSWGFVSKYLTDFVQSRQLVFLKTALVLLAVNILAENVLYPVFKTLYTLCVLRNANSLRKDCVRRLLAADPRKLTDLSSSDVTNRVQHDISRMKDFFQNSLLSTVIQLFSGVLTLAVIAWYSWICALVSIAVGLAVFVLQKHSAKDISQIVRQKATGLKAVTNLALECFRGGLTIRQNRALPWLEPRTKTEIEPYTDSLAAEGDIGVRQSVIGVTAMLASNFGILLILIALVQLGLFELSVAVMAFALQRNVGAMFENVGRIYKNIVAQGTLYSRVLEVLTLEEHPFRMPIPSGAGRGVSLRDVSFAYEDSREVLHGVTADLPNPGVTVIVGANGSGKSTLLKVIAGLYEPSFGQVTSGGRIGFLEQQNMIFEGTLEENICMGEATPKDVLDTALSSAGLSRFASELAGRQLSADSPELSGGEVKRVCIARLLAHQSDILLMDEPLSSLDPSFAGELTDTILSLGRTRGVIIVEHIAERLLQATDQIIVMDQGIVAGIGSHEELLKQCPSYQSLLDRSEIS